MEIWDELLQGKYDPAKKLDEHLFQQDLAGASLGLHHDVAERILLRTRDYYIKKWQITDAQMDTFVQTGKAFLMDALHDDDGHQMKAFLRVVDDLAQANEDQYGKKDES